LFGLEKYGNTVWACYQGQSNSIENRICRIKTGFVDHEPDKWNQGVEVKKENAWDSWTCNEWTNNIYILHNLPKEYTTTNSAEWFRKKCGESIKSEGDAQHNV
jgi:hypothetical protein